LSHAGDVRGWSAGYERNADPDADRIAEVRTLLLTVGRNGPPAALFERAATIHAIGAGLLGPWIGVPGEVVDARKPVLGGCRSKIVSQFLDQERAAGFLSRTRQVGVRESPFGDPAGFASGGFFCTAFSEIDAIEAGCALRRGRWVARLSSGRIAVNPIGTCAAFSWLSRVFWSATLARIGLTTFTPTTISWARTRTGARKKIAKSKAAVAPRRILFSWTM
jgi:hypothetical protein